MSSAAQLENHENSRASRLKGPGKLRESRREQCTPQYSGPMLELPMS